LSGESMGRAGTGRVADQWRPLCCVMCCVLQIVAQAQTFILAGYETTANALAFTVYLLACNPRAQQRLLEEVDTVLGGR
jgi:hypothetical protein